MSRKRSLVPVGLLIAFSLLAFLFLVPSLRLVALSGCVLCGVTLPLSRSRQIDWFSSWACVVYSVFVGVLLRSIWITFDIPSAEVIDDMFLRGQSKDFLLLPMVLVGLGLASLTVGYLLGPSVPREIPLPVFRSDCWNERRLYFLTIILLGLSWAGIYFFIENTVGVLTVENMSAKRVGTTAAGDRHALGYLRWLALLSDLVAYIVVAKIISSRRFYFRDVVLCVLAVGTSLLFYVFTNSLGGVGFLFITMLAIFYYLRGGLGFLRLLFVGLAVLFSIKILFVIRMGARLDQLMEHNFGLAQLLDPIVVNLTFIDVSKTAHIMNAIPDDLDYQWGGTLVTILFAWVPRSLWPGKPSTNADAIVGQVVYGASEGAIAIPPGLIAEMYWNFWVPGVVIGCFACGFLLKVIYIHFRAYLHNRNVVLLYVTSFMILGVSFLGSSVTQVLIGFLMTFLPLYLCLRIITQRRAGTRSVNVRA